MADSSRGQPPAGGFWDALQHLSDLGGFWWDKAHQKGGGGDITATYSGQSASVSVSPGVLLVGAAVLITVVVLVTRK